MLKMEINTRTVQSKIHSNLRRKLKRGECIQIARLCKQYGVKIVYNVCSVIEYNKGYFLSNLKIKLQEYVSGKGQIDFSQVSVEDMISNAEDKRRDLKLD